MEASGQARWFERLLAELDLELRLGDAAVIRAMHGRRKPKTDRLDAQHILHPMLKEDFPKIWIPSWGKPGPAATVVAPAPDGAGAHTHDEPTASGGTERRLTLQKEVVPGERTKTTGGASLGSLGEPAARGSAAVAGWADPTIAIFRQFGPQGDGRPDWRNERSQVKRWRRTISWNLWPWDQVKTVAQLEQPFGSQ